MTNHAERAVHEMGLAAEYLRNESVSVSDLFELSRAEAQMHATLHLAEQTRLNTIAILLTDSAGIDVQRSSEWTNPRLRALAVELVIGLGLEEPSPERDDLEPLHG